MRLLKIKKASESDWWNELSAIEKEKVVVGLTDSIEGRLTVDEVVSKKYGVRNTLD